MYKKFLAELIGTFGLALAVLLASQIGLPLGIPVLAGLVVGIFVYTIGPISGCHLNPAVTLGMLSIKRISRDDAVGYIVAQLVGAGAALVIGSALAGSPVGVPFGWFDLRMAAAEMLGTAILTFGIASVVFNKTGSSASGLVIGGSLIVGASMAAMIASGAGFLNPAVALGLHALNLTTIVGPLAGSFLGFWTYRALV